MLFHPSRIVLISDFICFQYSAIYSVGSAQGQDQLKVTHVTTMSNLNTLARKAVTFVEHFNVGQTKGDKEIRD